MAKKERRKRNFLYRHSLSIVSAAVLVLWIALYRVSDPSTHRGAFFGNAIADWTGLLVMVLATKYMYEIGSAESRQPPRHWLGRGLARVQKHSLSLFLVATGAGWAFLFASLDPTAKWGQVIGNLLSEWTQILGLVVLTKQLMEPGSKESSDGQK